MHRKKQVLFFLCIVLCGSVFAQSSKKTDSLFEVYTNTNLVDSVRLKAFLQLSFIRMEENPDTIIHLSNDALKLCINPNTNKYKAKIYRIVGHCQVYNGNYQNAISSFQKELKLWESMHDKISIAKTHEEIGITHIEISDYPNALEHLLKAMRGLEGSNEKKDISRTLVNLGLLHYYQNDFNMALEYFFKSLKLNEELKNKVNIAVCVGNIGMVYHDQHNYTKAMEYYTKSLEVQKQMNNSEGIAGNLGNIAILYTDLKDYKKALDYHYKSLEIYDSLDAKSNISIAYLNIGALYNKIGNYNEGLNKFKLALAISEQSESIDNLRLAHEGLAQSYEKLGNYKEAFKNYVKFKVLTDSIFNEENNKAMGEIKTQYEVAKKEAEFKSKSEIQQAINASEKKRQRLIIYAVVGILILVSVFSFLLFKRFKLTNKQKHIIEVKSKETLEQKLLVEEKQREIIESITYAKRLQEAILPPQAFINEYIPDNFIIYKPKDLVAGDFYWAEKINELFFIAVADSTGHGVPGAMVSVVCSNALNRTVKEFNLIETNKILDKTRELVLETFEKSTSEVKDGMDVSLLCIDHKNKKITWSGANNPLWYVLNNEIIEIKADKQPIGKTYNPKPFTSHQIEYKENTVFYLFTDGFADQFGGPNGKKFKYKQFSDLLVSSNNNLHDQQREINKRFESWKGNLEQVDDVCVVGIKI